MRRTDDTQADVGMSPLIDCVFLLLIFFLVATMLKKEKRDINITPPESQSAVRLLPDDGQLVLGVDLRGEVFWQGTPMTLQQLHLRLRELALTDPSRRVRLDADAQAPFEQIVRLLDICQFNGLHNVGIRTYDNRYNR
jgi:biopolymer transport protein ExbD